MPGGLVSRILGYFRGKPVTVNDYFADYAHWTPVASSNLSSVAFYESPSSVSGNILGIRFRNGSEYRYFGVVKSVYLGLLQAASKGGYHHKVIKGKFPYQKAM